MVDKPNMFIEHQLKNIRSFVEGTMSREVLISKIEDSDVQQKWVVMKYVARDSMLFHSFMFKIPTWLRFKVLLNVHEIKNLDLRNMGFSGSIDAVFKEELKPKRGISKLELQLAVILELPAEFLLFNRFHLQESNLSFMEYDYSISKITDLQNLVDITLAKTLHRTIEGWIFNCNSSESIIFKNQYGIAKTDRRVNFFTLEFFIQSKLKLNYEFLTKIRGLLKNKVIYIFITDAMLRDAYKIIFVGSNIDRNIINLDLEDFVDELRMRFRSEQIYPVNRV